MASDGLRIGLAIPFFPMAKAWTRSWGGAWSFGARMWVFSNDDFKRRVLPGLAEALATQPTFHAEGLRDQAVDAWRNADRERFVAQLDAQLIPLEAGGHLFQSAYDSLVIRALKRLGAVFHGPAKAWEIQAPIDQALATLDEVAGLAEHLIYRHDQRVTLEDMPALPKITALRQCLESLKIDYILERIRELDQDDKVLVFCEYVATVDELVATLTAEGIGCVSLTGSDSTGKRQAAVDRFQGEAVARVFIGTSGAAGVGITLTAANVVMFAGLPWTPALKRQAEDRAWRNGQKRPVTVIIPLVPKTIDEDLYKLLEAKTGIENELIDASQDERAMMNAVMRSASASAVS